MASQRHQLPLATLVLVCCLAVISGADAAVGVNYGTVANNLPSPADVVALLKTTTITRVKLYDADQTIVKAFAGSGLSLIVGVSNDQIFSIARSASFAQQWVSANIAPHVPAVNIIGLVVGNEVLTESPTLKDNLVPAMQNLHTGLVNLGLSDRIKISTPHSFGVIAKSYPPNQGAFRADLAQSVFKPMLDFLSQTGAPFMINTYPYFAFREDTKLPIAYTLFQPTTGITDPATGLHYDNMFDAQVDAVYAAMSKLGHEKIRILVSESGWPSAGDVDEPGVGIMNAQTYNTNLLKHLATRTGSPARPSVAIETYIFSLFNENQKPGPTSERNFGLFLPDRTSAYNVGILQGGPPSNSSSPPAQSPPPAPPSSNFSAPPPPPSPTPKPSPPAPVAPSPPSPPPPFSIPPPPPFTTPPAPVAPILPPPAPVAQLPSPPPASPAPGAPAGRTWCVARPGSSNVELAKALNFACGEGLADCSAIKPGGPCFQPDTIFSHASYAFDSYYAKYGRNSWNCYFNGTSLITITNPSYNGCAFP